MHVPEATQKGNGPDLDSGSRASILVMGMGGRVDWLLRTKALLPTRPLTGGGSCSLSKPQCPHP